MNTKFQVKDDVVYGSYGVCEITDIEDKCVGGQSVKYYRLTPIYETSSTVFVPVENSALTDKMRPMLSSDEIHSIIDDIPNEETIWIDNESARKERFSEIISSGNRTTLLNMVRSIYLHKKALQDAGKKLHITDERFLKNAEKLLGDEFAHVLNIKREEIFPFIFGIAAN